MYVKYISYHPSTIQNRLFYLQALKKFKSLEGTECPTVDIEIYNKRRKRDCSETIIN